MKSINQLPRRENSIYEPQHTNLGITNNCRNECEVCARDTSNDFDQYFSQADNAFPQEIDTHEPKRPTIPTDSDTQKISRLLSVCQIHDKELNKHAMKNLSNPVEDKNIVRRHQNSLQQSPYDQLARFPQNHLLPRPQHNLPLHHPHSPRNHQQHRLSLYHQEFATDKAARDARNAASNAYDVEYTRSLKENLYL